LASEHEARASLPGRAGPPWATATAAPGKRMAFARRLRRPVIRDQLIAVAAVAGRVAALRAGSRYNTSGKPTKQGKTPIRLKETQP